MHAIDRRAVFLGLLYVAGASLALTTGEAEAAPLDPGAARRLADLIRYDVTPAQVVVVGRPPPRRRHRRWVCWRHRGRRVCGWRWV